MIDLEALTDAARRRLNKLTRRYGAWSTIRLPPIPPVAPDNRAIAMATTVRNEGPFLSEWIDFHRFLGVSHVVVYDNGSTDDGPAILRAYERAGLATVIPWRLFNADLNVQTLAYAHALANFGHRFRWMGFFDVDEFVFPVRPETLDQTLARYERTPALGVVGVNFGTSGHEARPQGLVTRAYRHAAPLAEQRRFPRLLNVKSFVQPSRIAATASAHYFRLKDSAAVGFLENGAALNGYPRRQPDELSCDVIRYNHYFTRSRAEFEAKAARPTLRGPRFSIEAGYRRQLFEAIEAVAAEDRAIDVHLDAFERWRATDGRVAGAAGL